MPKGRRRPATAVGIRNDVYDVISRIAKIRKTSVLALCTEILCEYGDKYFKAHTKEIQQLEEAEAHVHRLREKLGSQWPTT